MTAGASARDAYDASWVAVYRLVREGESWSGRERNCAFLNTGDGRFADASALLGLDHPDDGRAAAIVDWDADGALDLVTTNRTGPRVRLLRNAIPPSGEFVAIRLEGRTCNRDAIGARVEVHLEDGRRLVRGVRAGDSYLAQSTRWLHFGLGAAGAIRRVVVRWPWGEAEEVAGVAPGKWHRIVQGTGRAETWKPPAAAALAPAPAPEPPRSTEAARIVLPSRAPLPALAYLDAADPETVRTVGGGDDRAPFLVHLWASWCAPCLAEIEGLSKDAERISRTGLGILALSVDAEADRPRARAFLERMRWRFGQGFATAEALGILEALQRSILDRHRPLPLPSSFLVDGDGRIAAIYKGPVETERLLADLDLLGAGAEENLAAALPFAGRWHAPPPALDLAGLARALEDRGFAGAAREVDRGDLVVSTSSPARIHHEIGLSRARQGQIDAALDLFRRAAELEPDFFEARRDLATALHQNGDLAGAIAEYRAALALRPAEGRTLFNLAVACAQSGDREGAMQARERLAEVDAALAADLLARLRTERGW